ncbi:MAG: phosphoribosylamine--glycine ligase [Actinomycetota bacterium]
MKALVIGGGGREHALVWALSRSSRVGEIVCAPGNPGISELAECVATRADDISHLVELARSIRPDLVVVGPEAPLVAGLADALERHAPVFGPSSSGARLEGSKAFAKDLMASKSIPTAESRTFDNAGEAFSFVEDFGRPVVIKADGLAAGKGVTVCDDTAAARDAITKTMVDLRFGEAGSRIVVEERLTGPELSILAFCDGKTVLPMQAAQDFKRALDSDLGSNTGGMGSYSPVPVCTPSIFRQAQDVVLGPIAEALAEQGTHYVGMIYAGLMLTDEGLKVIEFNCRFGDPEIQALIPRFDSDLAEVMAASIEGSLAGMELKWKPDSCVTVVAASEGYPDEPRISTGFPIEGLTEAGQQDRVVVFHSGTGTKTGRTVTAGGRVLSISALGVDIAEARDRAYAAISKISFHGMQFRSDIAAVADSRVTASAKPL